MFNEIVNEYIDLWAQDKTIANFFNFWINEGIKNNPKNFIRKAPTIIALVWNVRAGQKKEIALQPKISIPFIIEVKNEYLKLDSNLFLNWLLKNKPKNFYSCSYSDIYCDLLLSASVLNLDYANATDACAMQINLINSRYNYPSNIIKELEPISNLSKYSELNGKVSQKSRDIIVDYYNLYAKHKGALKDLSKSIRGKCIVDVVKKYDLLNGKPKDGYYYPVNDMKIKVESD